MGENSKLRDSILTVLEDVDVLEKERDELLSKLAESKAQSRGLAEALSKADEAMLVWLHSYAGEFCDEKDVEKSRAIIRQGGTLSYIGEAHGVIRSALRAYREGENPKHCCYEQFAENEGHDSDCPAWLDSKKAEKIK
jgi:hypothetical protein